MSPQYRNVENFEPGMMYHPRGGAKHVSTPEQKAELVAKGYRDTYVHQHYPTVLIHEKHGKKVCQSAEEHKTLGDGWKRVGYEPAPEPTAEQADEQAAQLEALAEQVSSLQAMAVENAKLREQLAELQKAAPTPKQK